MTEMITNVFSSYKMSCSNTVLGFPKPSSGSCINIKWRILFTLSFISNSSQRIKLLVGIVAFNLNALGQLLNLQFYWNDFNKM